MRCIYKRICIIVRFLCLYWPDSHLYILNCRHLVSTFMMSTFYDHVTSLILTARGFFATLMFDQTKIMVLIFVKNSFAPPVPHSPLWVIKMTSCFFYPLVNQSKVLIRIIQEYWMKKGRKRGLRGLKINNGILLVNPFFCFFINAENLCNWTDFSDF